MSNEQQERPKTLDEIKAEARAYALADTGQKKRVPMYSFQAPNMKSTDVVETMHASLKSVVAVHNHQQQHAPFSSLDRYHPVNMDNLDEDYAHFVKVLGAVEGCEESNKILPQMVDDDEEDEFLLDPMESDDEEEEDDEADQNQDGLQFTYDSPRLTITSPVGTDPLSPATLMGADFYDELQEELDWLEEEDVEAAVATLLEIPGEINNLNSMERNDPKEYTHKSSIPSLSPPLKHPFTIKSPLLNGHTTGAPNEEIDMTPIRQAARVSYRVVPSKEQQETLRSLLEGHHQLLLQQAVLAVRAANSQRKKLAVDVAIDGPSKSAFVNGDGEAVVVGDDLVEVLDSAVAMLQDLEQNRKDAIRSELQFESVMAKTTRNSIYAPNRSLSFVESSGTIKARDKSNSRRLTRAQFTKSLLQQNQGQARTVFDMKGLSKLHLTFTLIDSSVDNARMEDSNLLLLSTVRQFVGGCFRPILLWQKFVAYKL